MYDFNEDLFSSSDNLEPFSEPEYDLQYDDNTQFFIPDLIDAVDSYDDQYINDPVQVLTDDHNIIYSPGIRQSRDFIFQNMGISSSSLRTRHVPGLVVLRLEDFNLIRCDKRSYREFPHFIIGPPSEEFLSEHPDFNACFNVFYSK